MLDKPIVVSVDNKTELEKALFLYQKNAKARRVSFLDLIFIVNEAIDKLKSVGIKNYDDANGLVIEYACNERKPYSYRSQLSGTVINIRCKDNCMELFNICRRKVRKDINPQLRFLFTEKQKMIIENNI